MAREAVTVTIDGKSFTIHQIDPFKSFRIFTRLTKLAAPAGGRLAEAAASAKVSGKNLLDADVGSGWFADALREVAEGLDEETLEKTLRELLAPVQLDGRNINFMTDFAGEVPLMLRVAAEVIRVEFGGFLKFVPEAPSPGAAGATSP